jgi:hypothetical protein
MNMKQPATAFSFKRNNDVSALPDAKPEPVAPKVSKPKAKGKPGRKPESADGARKTQVAGYLTEAENEKFKEKLDGRPAAAVVRNLILDYINHD